MVDFIDTEWCDNHKTQFIKECPQCKMEANEGFQEDVQKGLEEADADRWVEDEVVMSTKPAIVAHYVDITEWVVSTKEEAEAFTNALNIKTSEWVDMMRFAHDNQVYRWLGYSSWEKYVEERLPIGVRQSYNILNPPKQDAIKEGAEPKAAVDEAVKKLPTTGRGMTLNDYTPEEVVLESSDDLDAVFDRMDELDTEEGGDNTDGLNKTTSDRGSDISKSEPVTEGQADEPLTQKV